MPFSNYKSVSSVLRKFKIEYSLENYIDLKAIDCQFPVPPSFQEELDILFSDGVFDNSEAAICENLIYPVLKEVWKSYRRQLTLWSHQSLTYDEDLSGVPDYMVTQRNPLGTIVFDKPYLLAVEAKQDKFEEGWGQCLAEMVAVQRLNENPDLTVFGIVSNGRIWQFGKLHGNLFTLNRDLYTLQDLERLFSVVNYMFRECQSLTRG
jgi:hypothetical protein